MSWTNRVVWREGMFLRPQHFQQQDRYLHHLLESRVASLRPCSWGINELELDRSLLKKGKIAVSRCSGVFDDGTPFDIPDGERPSPVLEITGDASGMTVFLVMLRSRMGATEFPSRTGSKELSRHVTTDWDLPDTSGDGKDDEQIEVSKLRLRLVLERDRLSDDSCIAVARIAKVDDDGSVTLDETHVPPCLDCNAQPALHKMIADISGLLRVRAEYLGARITAGSRGGVAEVAKYLLLQLVNRYEPLYAHWISLRGLHPLDFYEISLQLAGELSTFNPESHRPPEFPAYKHDNLGEILRPVVQVITRELTRVPDETATEIPLKSDRYGFHVAVIGDINLGPSGSFVLAAQADMPTENLRRDFPPQVTIGAPQQVSQLVKSHLPGVGLFPLPTTPPQIPFHAGYTYFELDRNSPHWKLVSGAKGIALHIPENFPGLALTLWAIKG